MSLCPGPLAKRHVQIVDNVAVTAQAQIGHARFAGTAAEARP